MILGDPRLGIADEAHAMRGEIVKATEIVVQRAGQRISIEGVHREIAARCVVAPVGAESDGRAATIGRNVAAQRRNFDRPMVNDRRHRTMSNAGRHGLEACVFDAFDHIFRPVDGCDVDVLDRESKQAVTHGSTDEARLADVPAKRFAELARPLRARHSVSGSFEGRAALIALH